MATLIDPFEEFLRPLYIDIPKIHSLAKELSRTYTRLAAESEEQFLPTPISDSVLRPQGDHKGRFLAIDIGGTNLRVGFIELLGNSKSSDQVVQDATVSRVNRHLEKSWPIGELLKKDNAEDLFAWIGRCVAEVIRDALQRFEAWHESPPDEISMGVTFSFPMIQHTIADATLMSMGKGFAITSNLDLANQLLDGYNLCRGPKLPKIKIAAICNDAVATLISFVYQFRSDPTRKAAMGLIVGTGCNATIPLPLSKLHPNKKPKRVKISEDDKIYPDTKVTVNTEWTIKGAAGPLHELNFITHWDQLLDAETDAPGFQPFEYMTAGRYIGELGRIITLDYFVNHLSIHSHTLPKKLLQRHGLTTTFLGNLGPHLSESQPSIIKQLNTELPPISAPDAFQWTQETANVIFGVAKAVQVRAAGMTAAAIIGLLACADELTFLDSSTTLTNGQTDILNNNETKIDELMVGYTGGCIVHFQDYLEDCQGFLDAIMRREYGDTFVPRVVLQSCHDGGIIGAGVLAGTVQGIGSDG